MITKRRLKKAARTGKAHGRLQRRLRPDLAYRVKHSSIAAVQVFYPPVPIIDGNGTILPITVVYSNGGLDCSVRGYSVGLPPEAIQSYLLRQFRKVFALPVSEREAFVKKHQQLVGVYP